MLLKLTNVRLSYPHLFQPTAFKPGMPLKFKATFLIPKGSAQHKEIEAAIKDAATAKWGAKADQIIKSIRGNSNKFCFQDGDLSDKEEYHGNMSITASNAAKPLILDRDPNVHLTPADGRPYAGCYVNANIEIYAYDKSGNGISANLGGVQYNRAGDSFVGGTPAKPEDFDNIGMDDENEPPC